MSLVSVQPAHVSRPWGWPSAPARWFRGAFQDLLLAPLLRLWCAPFRASRTALPTRPVVFVANHASHLDAPAILAALPRSARGRLRVAAAEDYFYSRPLLGRLVTLGMGAFPFPRQGTLGIQRAEALLAQGHSVLVFPEGTRSPNGCQSAFRHGVGHLLLNTGVAAIPVAIVGTHALWPRGRRLPRRGPLSVRVGAPWTPNPDLPAAAIADQLAAEVADLVALPVESREWWLRRLAWGLARRAFRAVGRLSRGIQVGLKFGFSSGEMLDYVYENRAGGRGPIGRGLDRAYLSSPGWRGIRERRANLVRVLTALVLARRSQGLPTRILDIAAGQGRYLLDLAEALGEDGLSIDCRDADSDALERGRGLAVGRGLTNVSWARHDALDPNSLAAIRPRPDVVVVSGLYEILLDDAAIRRSLRAIGSLLPAGGLLVLTGQPRHPQLALIAHVLTHRDGSPWRMRLRSTPVLEAWCREAGLVDLHTHSDTQAIFTVTLGRKP